MNKQELEMLSKDKQRSENGFDALKQFVIDQKACNYCGACISVCPKGSLAMGDESPELVDDCNSCGVCAGCPRTFSWNCSKNIPSLDLPEKKERSWDMKISTSSDAAHLVGS